LRSFTYRGYVTSLDPDGGDGGNLSILTTHQWGCSFENDTQNCGWKAVTPFPLAGTVPADAAFSIIRSGQVVEVSSLGMPGGHWTGIGVLTPVYAEQGYFATALVGDPSSLPVPLINGYSIIAETEPDCDNCSGSICPATFARITVTRNGAIRETATLYPAESYQYRDEKDKSGVDVAFISGLASAALCPNSSPFMTGVQPISIFTVSLIPPSGERSPIPGADTGSVSILSVPSGSVAYLGHEMLGVTPITSSGLQPGLYTVTLKKDGFLTWEKQITIRPGIPNLVTAKLVPGFGTLSVKSFPLNASILLDGEMQGYTPLIIPNVPAGPHFVEITKPGYQAVTKTAQVPAGSIGLVVASLSTDPSEIQIPV
jgi:hypothetical protein